jgi:hypothetical protein
MPCRRIIAIAIAEIPVILFADLPSAPQEIRAFIVLAVHQIMVPAGFISGIPDRQLLPAMRAGTFGRHWFVPPEQ